MKKLIFILLFSAAAFPQGFRVDSQAIGAKGPIANVIVTVCTANATGVPCSPTATTFTDSTLGTACTAGLAVTLTGQSSCQSTSDSLGNYGFWVAPGSYTYSLSGPGITGKLYSITASNGFSPSGTIILPTPIDIGASDTGLSRIGAGLVAFGNGTQGDTSGSAVAQNGNFTNLNTTSLFQSAATLLTIFDNQSGIRFQIPPNGTNPTVINNAQVGGGSNFTTTQNFQKFASSGTFTVPTNIKSVKVTIVGGGGAGGGATITNNGGGGGSGGIAIKYLTGLTPGNTIAVTVGAGGTGVSATTGNTGAASSIASGTQTITTVTAAAGIGGPSTGATSSYGSGAAISTNGDINGGGNPGNPVYAALAIGGNGGATFLGGAGSGGGGSAGNPALANTGGGGGGAGSGASTAGGNGGSGVVIFEWTN
jgi:hypothetical protein